MGRYPRRRLIRTATGKKKKKIALDSIRFHSEISNFYWVFFFRLVFYFVLNDNFSFSKVVKFNQVLGVIEVSPEKSRCQGRPIRVGGKDDDIRIMTFFLLVEGHI